MASALENAYKVVQEAEVKLIADLEAILNDATAKVNELASGLPESGQSSGARQFLGRVQGAISQVATYDLTNVRMQYGIGAPTSAA